MHESHNHDGKAWEYGDEDDDDDDYEEEDGDMIKMKMIKMTMTMFTSSCPSGGRLMFLTLSRMICRIVFRKAFRNSDVLGEDGHDDDFNIIITLIIISIIFRHHDHDHLDYDHQDYDHQDADHYLLERW